MKNSQVSNCQFIPPPERLHGRESTLAAFHAPVRDFMNNTLSNQSQIKQYYAANIKLNRTINQIFITYTTYMSTNIQHSFALLQRTKKCYSTYFCTTKQYPKMPNSTFININLTSNKPQSRFKRIIFSFKTR